MRLFNYLFPLAASMYLLVGCTSIKTLVINVEKPALIMMPTNINYISVVNSAAIQPSNVGHIIMKGKNKSITKEQAEVASDSLNLIFCQTLTDNLKSKNFFGDVDYYKYPVRTDENYKQMQTLDSTLVQEICQIMDADGIISLDKFAVSSEVSPLTEYGEIMDRKTLTLSAEVVLNIFNYTGKSISTPLSFTDSLFWTESYNQGSIISESLPETETAAKALAYYIAEKLTGAFVPYWESQPRWYYSDGGKNIKQVAKKIETNDWDSVITLWKESYDLEQKPKRKARLAHNIALAYEMTDKLMDASVWIKTAINGFAENEETSIDTENLKRAQQYEQELSKRYADFRLLDKQQRITN